MILICGIASETPIELITDELDILGADYLLWNQRKFMETDISFTLNSNGFLTGVLKYQGKNYPLENFAAIYYRLTDWTTLPEIEKEKDNNLLKEKCKLVHVLMQHFIDHSPALVINRSRDMMSNNSKPYQLFIAKNVGIKIPDTCITTDKETALEFLEEQNHQVIYKSISGTRSIVQRFKESDKNKLDRLFFCPTQFQQYVNGQNMRVHVINDVTITTAIKSDEVDYRYAFASGGKAAQLEHVELTATKKLQCIRFSKKLNLFFSGLDFKEDEDGELTCFEANPMPGYSYYEQSASQPIAYTLATAMHLLDTNIT